jgi:hypothetical protein
MICPYLKSRLFWHYEIFSCRDLFWLVFSSAEWFGTAFRELVSIFVSRNGIPSCFFFHGRDRHGIPRVCFNFVPCNGIRSCFLFRGRVGTKFLEFSVLWTAGIPSERTSCSFYSVFYGIICLSENSQFLEGGVRPIIFWAIFCDFSNQ